MIKIIWLNKTAFMKTKKIGFLQFKMAVFQQKCFFHKKK